MIWWIYNRSYLNRWLSADTIVPDPANPQSLNRYSYVHNNPLRYIDPSGHCGADTTQTPLPNGDFRTEQDIQKYNACVAIRDPMQNRYGVTIEGTWSLLEMEALALAFSDIEAGFHGLDHTRAVYRDTIIRRLNEDGQSEVSIPINVVKVRNGTFSQGAGIQAAHFVLIHELLHRMDMVHGLDLSEKYETATGGKTETLLGGTCSREVAGSLSGACTYTAGPNVVSNYAKTDRREDFADSGAAYVYSGNINNLTGTNTNHRINGPLNVDRSQAVQDLIDRSWAILDLSSGG